MEDLLPEQYKYLAAQLDKGTQVFDVYFDTGLSWDFALAQDFHSNNDLTPQINTHLEDLV